STICGSTSAIVSIHLRRSGLTGLRCFLSLLGLGLFSLGRLWLLRLWLLDLFRFRLRLWLGLRLHFRLFNGHGHRDFRLFRLDHIRNDFFRFLNGLRFRRGFGRGRLFRLGRRWFFLHGF